MGRLFGTDGIRGIANTELTCELTMNIGRAAAMVLIDNKRMHPKILIGKDTRRSSDMLENAFTAGLCSVGANVVSLGVVPTPAVAHLVVKYRADAGVMISASHNPFEFNGVKIFSGDGFKLPDALEEQIEAIVLDENFSIRCHISGNIGDTAVASQAVRDYINHVKSTVSFDLSGLKVALDCANGSASKTAEALFTELGAECFMLHDKPNGININENCGSTHMASLMQYVKKNKLDAGIAFDGDADRCLAVDEKGHLVDGDFIMAICAADMKSRGKLAKDTVVGTIMTNMGFSHFCEQTGLQFIATKVGDRYVLEEMLQEQYNFGGEQSGHIIFRDFATTGDGQLTAAHLLSLLRRRDTKFSNLSHLMTRFPQVIINVNISTDGKVRFYTDYQIKKAIEDAKQKLGKDGRIIVRPSGTEPLLRVMVEGRKQAIIEKIAAATAAVIQEQLA